MMKTMLFPTILIALDIMAAIVYLFDLDYRHSIYWFSAAVLTASVTF